ncbi:MAG: CoA transferase [Clostridiales bacterium]|nr:CoA transferase [Clostridiales bacterium]
MGSLDGLKVLDFSTLLPGPYASLMLADMGAEVLTISSPSKYDLVQHYGAEIEGTGISACSAWLGRNKKTMFLNLKTAEGKEIVRRLISDYDIVLEQFRPGVMQKLGLGFDELRALNPRLIYCSLTGYGQTGPLADAAGHDINYMSRSGIISHAGRTSDGPSLMNFQIADIAAGSMNAVIGILAAVYHREQTGQGQFIDISMMDGCVPFNSLDGADFLVSGRQPVREGEMLNGGCMYDYYETSDGGYMSVGSLEPKFWENFCRCLGREDLIAGTVSPENAGEIKEQIRAIFRTKTRDEWSEIFKNADACVQPVMDLNESLLQDEQVRAREMVVEVGMPLHEDVKVKQMATAVKLSGTPCEYRHAGYPPGYHTREVIESLGFDYDTLKEKGVFD